MVRGEVSLIAACATSEQHMSPPQRVLGGEDDVGTRRGELLGGEVAEAHATSPVRKVTQCATRGGSNRHIPPPRDGAPASHPHGLDLSSTAGPMTTALWNATPPHPLSLTLAGCDIQHRSLQGLGHPRSPWRQRVGPA